jgi:uncharacterized CHY-type Zn-finger protein
MIKNNFNNIIVKGKLVNGRTGCVHYHSSADVIAIKFKCCNEYYSCYYCHQEVVGHSSQKWGTNELDIKAIHCGICKSEMTIERYLTSNYQCPFCKIQFNANCSRHNHLYFQ